MDKELHIPLLEEAENYTIVWHPVAVQAPIGPTLWVRTRSGIVATGYFQVSHWAVDATRIKDSFDELTHWAEIEHPRGPRVPSAATD